MDESRDINAQFQEFIRDEAYPCVAARAALNREQIPTLIVGHMACGKDDPAILEFLYGFIDRFRSASTSLHSAAVIFRQPAQTSEELFETLLWQRLQSLSILDAKRFAYDKRVSMDPMSPEFSYSIGEEAFFVIGLHQESSRPARRFNYPTIVFNPHVQFDELRKTHRYEKMKSIVRKRDVLFSGSINPMLADFGESSEAIQYSGRTHTKEWTCPLNITHAGTKDHPAKE